jgi:uncharacterized SAM-binding protein YcdF (DUF218 family)
MTPTTTIGSMATAIVVPGHGAFEEDGYRISSRCLRLVAEAERLAERLAPRAVVFTGWSPGDGPSEAEQMRDAWTGPAVELVVEPTATVTAENATRTLPLLLERGVDRAVVLCAPLHVARTRFFFRRIYGPHGVEARVRAVDADLSARALAWELAAIPLARGQLRAARAELEKAAR